jgi:uncharacterized protein YueI
MGLFAYFLAYPTGGVKMANNEEKSELEKKVFQGVHGTPELKKDEKNSHLDEFRERVICSLKYNQVVEPGVYPEVLEAIKKPEAKKLVITRKVGLNRAQDYIDLARKNNLTFKRVDSPKHRGDIALVVASNTAIDVKQREIPERKDKLQKLEIPVNIINNVGSHLCPNCWEELEKKAPEELINYQKASWFERLLGVKCINCQ